MSNPLYMEESWPVWFEMTECPTIVILLAQAVRNDKLPVPFELLWFRLSGCNIFIDSALFPKIIVESL